MYKITVKHALLLVIAVTAILGFVSMQALSALVSERERNELFYNASIQAVENVTLQSKIESQVLNQKLDIANKTIGALVKSYDSYQRMIITRDITVGERICELLGYGNNNTVPLDGEIRKIVDVKKYYGALSPDSRYVICYNGEFFDHRDWWQELLNVSLGQSPPPGTMSFI